MMDRECDIFQSSGIIEYAKISEQYNFKRKFIPTSHSVTSSGAEGWAAEFTIVDAGVVRSLLSRREGKGWQAGQIMHPLPPSRWGSSHGALPPCGRSRQRRQ